MADGPAGTTDPVEPDRKPAWRELPLLVLTAVVLAVIIKSFLVQAFFIPSPSMVPTLRRGDRILVCRVCMHISDIDRGDILVFSDPDPEPGDDRGVIGGFFHWLGEGIGVAHPDGFATTSTRRKTLAMTYSTRWATTHSPAPSAAPPAPPAMAPSVV